VIRVAVLFAVTMALAGWHGALAGQFLPTSGLVVYVFDGDTLKVESGGRSFKVRVLGIDTPEVGGPYTRIEPFGRMASDRTKALALGKRVRLEYGSKRYKDRFGRLLAYVTLPDGRDLGRLLITEGLAEAFRSTRYGRKKLYHQLEAQARKARLGIWSKPRKRR